MYSVRTVRSKNRGTAAKRGSKQNKKVFDSTFPDGELAGPGACAAQCLNYADGAALYMFWDPGTMRCACFSDCPDDAKRYQAAWIIKQCGRSVQLYKHGFRFSVMRCLGPWSLAWSASDWVAG